MTHQEQRHIKKCEACFSAGSLWVEARQQAHISQDCMAKNGDFLRDPGSRWTETESYCEGDDPDPSMQRNANPPETRGGN